LAIQPQLYALAYPLANYTKCCPLSIRKTVFKACTIFQGSKGAPGLSKRAPTKFKRIINLNTTSALGIEFLVSNARGEDLPSISEYGRKAMRGLGADDIGYVDFVKISFPRSGLRYFRRCGEFRAWPTLLFTG
jgi:hypothetical protein